MDSLHGLPTILALQHVAQATIDEPGRVQILRLCTVAITAKEQQRKLILVERIHALVSFPCILTYISIVHLSVVEPKNQFLDG